MPIYEIVCRDCGNTAEALVLSSREALTCPTCGSRRTAKVMSAPSDRGSRAPSTGPGRGATACCGSTPGQAACAGPGSCCGKRY